MKQEINIISEGHRSRAIAIIAALPLLPEHTVIVRERKRDRSQEQSRLYWQWLTVIGNSLGESKESIHEQFKGKFLCTIYERDDPDYAEMLQTLRAVYREGMRVESLALRKKIIALTSTTTATVSQMSEYMSSIEHFSAELAIKLPFPEDS